MWTIFEKTYSQSALTIAKYKITFKTTNAWFKKNYPLFLPFMVLNETFKIAN